VTSVRREATPMVALAMARRKEFEGRMLAILDPELRHSTPSRTQSATLIGTLALLSIVVGAVVPAPASARPTATRNPSREIRETKHLAPAPAADESANVANDRPQAKRLERVVERARTATETHTSRTTSQETSATPMEQKAESAFERVVSSAVGVVMNHVVPNAIEKSVKDARKQIMRVCRQGTTIPHATEGEYGATKVRLLPAAPGTGIIAGKAVRKILERAGIADILTKNYGSTNAMNVVKATMMALSKLRNREQTVALRGVTLE
jgi:hypothetical protein